MTIQEYCGYSICFDDRLEVWYFYDKYNERQSDRSLKKLKSYIDRSKKNAFKRMPVYVNEKGDGWGRREGDGYEKAQLTSIDKSGKARVVRSKSKVAEIAWTIYEDNKKNEKLISEIEDLNITIKNATSLRDKKIGQLSELDLQALCKKVWGKEDDAE